MAKAKAFDEFVVRVLKGMEHRFLDEIGKDDPTAQEVVKAAYVHALRHYPLEGAEGWVIETLIWVTLHTQPSELLLSECAKTIDALKGRPRVRRMYLQTTDPDEVQRLMVLWSYMKDGTKHGRITLPAKAGYSFLPIPGVPARKNE